MEMYKNSNNRRQIYDNFYFWRGPKDLEVDIVVEGLNGKLEASECKYGTEIPSFKLFSENYPNAKTQVINPRNYLDLL
jgi:predicted AAA+ superfamily ATPase